MSSVVAWPPQEHPSERASVLPAPPLQDRPAAEDVPTALAVGCLAGLAVLKAVMLAALFTRTAPYPLSTSLHSLAHRYRSWPSPLS